MVQSLSRLLLVKGVIKGKVRVVQVLGNPVDTQPAIVHHHHGVETRDSIIVLPLPFLLINWALAHTNANLQITRRDMRVGFQAMPRAEGANHPLEVNVARHARVVQPFLFLGSLCPLFLHGLAAFGALALQELDLLEA